MPGRFSATYQAKVASGAYASESEVIREGLRFLEERDQAVEKWLREQVVPSVKAHLADPSRAVPIEEAFAGLKERYLARKAQAK